MYKVIAHEPNGQKVYRELSAEQAIKMCFWGAGKTQEQLDSLEITLVDGFGVFELEELTIKGGWTHKVFKVTEEA